MDSTRIAPGELPVAYLRNLPRRLNGFLHRFDDCLKTRPARRHLRTYVKGQTGPLERKSIEPIALSAGVAPRSLQEFLETHRWDEDKVRRRVHELVARDHASPVALALIDETSQAKKGRMTAGVQRQYCGSTGKTDNCIIAVHLGYAADDFYTLLDGDLYLPEETWDRDRARCRAAGIPDEVGYRPKWQIALDLLDRALAHGVRFRYLAADELYGRGAAFRHGVDARGLVYVVEVPVDLQGWTAPRFSRPARRVDRLGGPRHVPERIYRVKDTQRGPQVWRVRAFPFYPREDKAPGERGWLLVARSTADAEVKYFASNAPPDTPVEVLLKVAFSRAVIERVFEDAKGEVGLDHAEVRHYRPLMRHWVLSLVSLLFLAREAHALKKNREPVVEPVPGARRARSAGRPGLAAPAAPTAPGRGAAAGALPPTPRVQGRPQPPQKTVAPVARGRHLRLSIALLRRRFLAL
jgi:SRSO17 transposase